MLAIPIAVRRIVPLLAVVAALAVPRVVMAQCAGISEEGVWRNLDKNGEPSYINIKMLGGCGDQVRNGQQTGSRVRYTMRVFVRQADGKLFGRPSVKAVYRPWMGKQWLQGNVSTGGYQDELWVHEDARNGRSRLHVFISHKSLDSKPSSHSEFWFSK
jgi:hypothetical protein